MKLIEAILRNRPLFDCFLHSQNERRSLANFRPRYDTERKEKVCQSKEKIEVPFQKLNHRNVMFVARRRSCNIKIFLFFAQFSQDKTPD